MLGFQAPRCYQIRAMRSQVNQIASSEISYMLTEITRHAFQNLRRESSIGVRSQGFNLQNIKCQN